MEISFKETSKPAKYFIVVLLTAFIHETKIPDLVRHRRATAAITSCRIVRHRIGQIEPAEPPVGEVQMNLLAEPSLRSDAKAIPH